MSDAPVPPSDKGFEPLGQPASAGTTSPRMLVPLFLVPLLIVALIVGIFLGVGALIGTEKTVEQWIAEVETGGVNERWQAAANLSDMALKDREKLSAPATRERLRQLFRTAGPDDTRLRKWVADLWATLGDTEAAPLCQDGIEQVLVVLNSPGRRASMETAPALEELIQYVRALGTVGNRTSIETLTKLTEEADGGVRKSLCEALGSVGRRELRGGEPLPAALIDALLRLHGDSEVWVRINAALALAKCHRSEGLPTLETMLDRDWLKQQKLSFPDDGKYSVNAFDPAAAPIASALLAIDALHAVQLVAAGATPVRDAVQRATQDPNPALQARAKALLTKLGG